MNTQSWRRRDRLLAVQTLSGVVLCLLILLLWAQPAAAQDQPPPLPAAPNAPEAGPDCANPIPGDVVKLFDEDEIVVGSRSKSNKTLEYSTWDNSGASLVWGGNWFSSLPDVQDVRWPAITMADLNGDRQDEAVLAFRDKQERLAATTSSNFELSFGDGYYDGYQGGDVTWIDVDAGNLDKSADGDEEVVIAFSDDKDDIRLLVLNGSSSGSFDLNSRYGEWGDGVNYGRGDVEFVAAATGDLNGDGYDNEIVATYEDSNDDLELLLLRRDSYNLTMVWSKIWTDHDRGDVADDTSSYGNKRPIDITTGDIDGDKRDEVILGFRSGPAYMVGQVQMLVVDYQWNGNAVAAYDDRTYLIRGIGCSWQGAATSVAVSAADLEGDGQDEIALGFNKVCARESAKYWQQYLYTYEYVTPTTPGWQGCLDDAAAPRPCLQERPGSWASHSADVPPFVSEVNPEAQVVIDTGDLDSDGMAEIALIRQEHSSGDAQVHVFDADSGLAERGGGTLSWGGEDRVEEFWVAMGDRNGDSRYGTALKTAGSCRVKKEAQVTAVVNAPPHWEENDDVAEAGFGTKVIKGGGTGQTTESMIGGSVQLGFEVPIIKAGPSFTYEWEKSVAVEHKSITRTVDGQEFDTLTPSEARTLDPPGEPYFSGLEFVETKFWCYDYSEPVLGIMPVCLPQPDAATSTWAYPLRWWYTEGREEYEDSWVPVGINLAQGRAAIQSGTTGGILPAGRAVDGNTDGSINNNSVSQTAWAQNARWDVDLGGLQWIDAIQIWNRTDGSAEVLKNYYVFVSPKPFASNWPDVSLNDPEIWKVTMSEQAGRPTTIPVNFKGRYVRVQLVNPDYSYLFLAEVQVYGSPGTPDQWPTQRPVAGSGNFQLTWPGGLLQTVRGDLVYARSASAPALGVGVESSPVVFDVGVETENEQVTEYSTSSKTSIGMETKYTSAEYTTGTTDKTSYILSWSSELEFSGGVGGEGITTTARAYTYMPYIWLQQGTSHGGVNQVYLVVDYWVPEVGDGAAIYAPPPAAAPAEAVDAVPMPPLISSPSHPDPDTWYISSSVVFNWGQPPGDPTTVNGYRWFLDHSPDTIPPAVNLGLVTTDTYNGLADGVWYLHVRARSTGGQWSDTAHLRVRVDTHAPVVQLAREPAAPSGNNGWYITPVTVSVSAADGDGAGVANMEVSPDGSTWQPYGSPLVFTADTPGTSVYVRAADAAGQVSAPISTTFQIDRTAPDSHVAGGAGPGLLTAAVITNSAGNQELVLVGVVAEELSGRAGMSLEYNGLDWTTGQIGSWHPIAGQPNIEANWSFTATNYLGAGYHIFRGRASDAAGNQEEAYELGRVVHFPQASPNLVGSSVTASSLVVRPGEVVTFTIVARNGGWQEAMVSVADRLPDGLEPVAESLGPSVQYDAATRTLTWPAQLLRPGWRTVHIFQAVTGAGLPAASLENQAAFHAFWPNTDLLPPDQRQRFLDHEQTVVATVAVAVDPGLPAGVDVTPPWAGLLRLAPQTVAAAQVRLGILAPSDVQRMYLREWTADPTTGAWVVAQSSGWIGYSPLYEWTLSAGQGVKYLGVWVADGAGNVSTLDEHGLIFVNRADGNQTLADGQRIQYRGELLRGTWAIANLTTVAGDPDLYIWQPANGFRPDLLSNESVQPGQVEQTGVLEVVRTGRYLLEVQAVGASEYQLSLEGSVQAPFVAASVRAAKSPPEHPLVVSDPLSEGLTKSVLEPKWWMYLPEVSKQ